jgi:hypothetical protein
MILFVGRKHLNVTLVKEWSEISSILRETYISRCWCKENRAIEQSVYGYYARRVEIKVC